jgi:hypothetical protein
VNTGNPNPGKDEGEVCQMNKSNTIRYWIYLVIAWNIHNLEEALTMAKWYEANETKLPITEYVQVSTIQQIFPIAMIIATLLLFLIPILAIVKKWDIRILGIVLGIFLVNAIQHILTTIVFWGYAPGVVTALVINLPLSILLIRQLFKNNLLKNFSWFHIFAYGVVGFIISISAIWVLTISIYYACR